MSEEILEVEINEDELPVSSGCISFPEIGQFRTTVKVVRDRCAYDGRPLPVLRFNGSVKLHGTNASVVFFPDGSRQTQSRTNVITPGNDNAGFAAWVEANANLFDALALRITDSECPAVVYGEWCGRGIHKGVAINALDRMFVVFGIRHYRGQLDVDGRDTASYWFDKDGITATVEGTGLKHIYEYLHWTLDIDFARPEIAQHALGLLTTAVEKECPVGLAHGVEAGVGEGIVWWPEKSSDFNVRNLAFKVKGEKHSETKVKTLAPVDVEKISNMRELVATILTEHRLEKKLDDLKEQGHAFDIKSTGAFLKIVGTDIHKEEKDTIEASGLPVKEVMAMVSAEARQWWMKQLDKAVGL
jgi:hypothetical protein